MLIKAWAGKGKRNKKMKRVTPSVCLIIIFSVFCFGQKQNAERNFAGESFKNSENKNSRILDLRISGSSVRQKYVSEGGSGGSLLEGAEKAISRASAKSR